MKVLKPFKTRLQRFAEGAALHPSADLRPWSLETLEQQGYIAGSGSPQPAKPSARKPRKAR